jgi:glyoxylase-like metal-dependent hydrolase (beta-lactamase superfamily II)
MEYKVLALTHKETKMTVHPVIIFNNNDLILCDTGYRNQLSQIEEELNKFNFSIKDITKVIITHHDHDHIGSLKSIKDKNNALEIISSEIEADYIIGKKPPLRLLQIEEKIKTLTGKEKEFSLMFSNYLKIIENCPVDKFVKNEEYIIDNLKIIFTYGHSPGHVSLLLEDCNTLIAGDAVMSENNKFINQTNDLVFNRKDYLESIKIIKGLNINKIICYHGGIIDTNINNKLDEITIKKNKWYCA